MNEEEFLPDAEFDRLIATAMRSQVEPAPLPDLAARAARLGREQERVELADALKARLAQWERRKWWQRGISAVAAVVVLAMLWFGVQKLKQVEAAKAEATVAVTTDDGTVPGDATAVSDTTATADPTAFATTSSSSDAPFVFGGIALLAAVALLTIGRSLSGGDQDWAFATPRLT